MHPRVPNLALYFQLRRAQEPKVSDVGSPIIPPASCNWAIRIENPLKTHPRISPGQFTVDPNLDPTCAIALDVAYTCKAFPDVWTRRQSSSDPYPHEDTLKCSSSFYYGPECGKLEFSSSCTSLPPLPAWVIYDIARKSEHWSCPRSIWPTGSLLHGIALRAM